MTTITSERDTKTGPNVRRGVRGFVKRHGMKGTPEHNAWISLRDRCNNPRNAAYKNYGARGIKVHPQFEDFVFFYAEVGPRPSPAHSIDRIDNSKGYEPGNIRWATRGEQNANRRGNRFVVYRGLPLILRDAMAAAGTRVARATVRHRLYVLGWSVERALETPASNKRNSRGQRSC